MHRGNLTDGLASPRGPCYPRGMSSVAERLINEALSLSEDERLELAAELIASVDGPPDADWEAVWLAELDRRRDAAAARGEAAPEWAEVRARVLSRLSR